MDADVDDAGIYATESSAIGRPVQVGVASGRVLKVEFPTEPDPMAGDEHPVLAALCAYLETGDPETLEDVTVGLTVPTDQRRVLETLQGIPPGEEVTVAALARMTQGIEEDDRALVEAALSANPAPVLLPDHRVADAAGALPGPVRTHLRELEGL